MAARGQRPPERDGREGVAGVAEGGEEDAQLRAQTSSATSRTMRRRESASKAIGMTMSVPTPASR